MYILYYRIDDNLSTLALKQHFLTGCKGLCSVARKDSTLKTSL